MFQNRFFALLVFVSLSTLFIACGGGEKPTIEDVEYASTYNVGQIGVQSTTGRLEELERIARMSECEISKQDRDFGISAHWVVEVVEAYDDPWTGEQKEKSYMGTMKKQDGTWIWIGWVAKCP